MMIKQGKGKMTHTMEPVVAEKDFVGPDGKGLVKKGSVLFVDKEKIKEKKDGSKSC
jgi:hypothetical protein